MQCRTFALFSQLAKQCGELTLPGDEACNSSGNDHLPFRTLGASASARLAAVGIWESRPHLLDDFLLPTCIKEHRQANSCRGTSNGDSVKFPCAHVRGGNNYRDKRRSAMTQCTSQSATQVPSTDPVDAYRRFCSEEINVCPSLGSILLASLQDHGRYAQLSSSPIESFLLSSPTLQSCRSLLQHPNQSEARILPSKAIMHV